MRILQVIPYFYPAFSMGGAVTVVYNISKLLAKRGHEVTVYTSNALDLRRKMYIHHNPQKLEGTRVHYFTNWGRFDGVYFTPEMLLTIKKEIVDFDVVHLHGFRSFQALLAFHYANRWCLPYIVSAHGTTPVVMGRKMSKKFFDFVVGHKILNKASGLIAVSDIEVEQYRRIGIATDKIKTIPNGVNIKQFERLPKPGVFRKLYKISEKNIILYLGRIHRRKRLDVLIEAFSQILETVNDVVLVICGRDDGYLEQAKGLSEKLGVAKKVRFIGPVTEERKIYAYVDSSLVVNIAVFEIFGLVPLEAALCGKPVIVSSDSGVAEFVKKGNFGFCINPADKISLEEHLRNLILDARLATKLGSNGRDFVRRFMSWEKIVPRLEELYVEVTGHC